jgi:hypothetical protein
LLEYRRIDNGLGVLDIICHNPSSTCSAVREGVYERAINVIISLVAEVNESGELLRKRGDGIDHHATPEGALGECFQIDACNDAEVVGATFEGVPEVRVAGGVGVYDASIGKDDLLVSADTIT